MVVLLLGWKKMTKKAESANLIHRLLPKVVKAIMKFVHYRPQSQKAGKIDGMGNTHFCAL